MITVVLSLFLGAFAGASDMQICEEILSRPLRHTPQPLYSMEISGVGRVLKPGTTVGHLASGVYLYLITDRGELVFARKYSSGLATHKGLVKDWARKRKRAQSSIKVVAAGEFSIGFGQVVTLNNRSGNFRGGSERLEFAKQHLQIFGLSFTGDTEFIDFSSDARTDLGHSPKDRDFDAYQFELTERFLRDERALELAGLYERLVRMLLPHAKNQSVVGVSELVLAAAAKYGVPDGLEIFIYPIDQARSADGFAFGILRLIDKEKPMHRIGPIYVRLLRHFLTSRLDRSEQLALERIAEDFERWMP